MNRVKSMLNVTLLEALYFPKKSIFGKARPQHVIFLKAEEELLT